MILVDSNIIIEFWRTPTEAKKKKFEDEVIFVCGIVRAEVLHGARNIADFKRIQNLLSEFPSIEISESVWETVGEFLFELRTRGFTIPFQDVVLAALAVEYDCEIWTKDKHFIMIQQVAPMLKLFVE